MAFNRFLEALHSTGSREDADFAKVVLLRLRQRGKDIPLPVVESQVRRPFTDEEKEALRREGLTAIYALTGETIADQKKKGRNFWYITQSDNNSVLTVHSLVGDVAVDPRPNNFFLPRSNSLTLDQQLTMVAEFSNELQKKLKTDSIEAVLGQVPDYSALSFAHLDATEERFFGKNYGYNFTRTQTPIGLSRVAIVGSFGDRDGLDVHRMHRHDTARGVWAAPLVVATRAV